MLVVYLGAGQRTLEKIFVSILSFFSLHSEDANGSNSKETSLACFRTRRYTPRVAAVFSLKTVTYMS